MSKIWIYGVNSVFALIEEKPEDIETVWYSRAIDSAQETAIMAAGIPAARKSTQEIQKVCGDVVHQGIAALCVPPRYLTSQQLMERIEVEPPPLLLVLDRLVDARNLGACLRTAEACGVHAVILPTDQSAELTPIGIKAASGSAMRVAVAKVVNLSRTLQALKEQGVWLTGACATASQRYDTVDYSRATAVVLGSEGKGLRRLVREQCDYLIQIPMQGKVESLNASIAAAVLLYEVQRQRQFA